MKDSVCLEFENSRSLGSAEGPQASFCYASGLQDYKRDRDDIAGASPKSFADEGVHATLAKAVRRGAPRSECMSSNVLSAAALLAPRMSAAKNWPELVPSLSGLVHGRGMLPGTPVPGFQVPPLRGWVMVPERLRCDSSAASRGDGSGTPEMRSVFYGCVVRWATTPVPQARNVKARHGNAG